MINAFILFIATSILLLASYSIHKNRVGRNTIESYRWFTKLLR